MPISTDMTARALEWLDYLFGVVAGWLVSPAAWSQFALLALAYAVAVVATRRIAPVLLRVLTPAAGAEGMLARARGAMLALVPLLLPVIAYALTAMGAELTAALFGSGAVIAFGQRVFLFIAARILVREVITDPFLRLMGRYVLIPVAALHMFGLLEPITQRMAETAVELGDIRFSVLGLVRGIIAGALLFWLGSWSNRQSTDYIKRQEDLRPATRELAVKAAEIAIFGAAFLLLMQVMGIDLTAIAVLGGALGVGIGLGLQQIAANFVSGVILLIEGQTTVGDYVELDDGQAGTIIRMTARACVIETVDGRWIVVPNENFITSRIVNYSDAGKAHRYEVAFSVDYDTDINRVPALIEAAISALPFVIQKPEPPECELKGFGDSGVDFSVEFWVNGIEDRTGSYQSPALFAIWNALKAEGIEIPYPRRVVELRGQVPA
jgi:potassium-dependent mechanosensitive channel